MNFGKNPNRVAIIGCNNFNAQNLYSLLMNGAVGELVLVEDDCEEILWEIGELQKSVPLAHPVFVFQGTCKDAASSKIVIIAAGTAKNPGESSVSSLSRNSEIVREIAGKLRKYNFQGVILVVANPVDVLAQIALEESGLPANKVIGSGKLLDKEKYREILNGDLRIDEEDNSEEIATWCAALNADAPLIDYCQPNCPEFGKMLDVDKRKPTVITRRKDSSLFSAGSCVTRICEAILRDERTILPVAAMSAGQYGISGVFMNMPCIIRRDGVEEILQLRIGEDEKQELLVSGGILKETNQLLEELRINSSDKKLKEARK